MQKSCYTCKLPRGNVYDHIIGFMNICSFHYDMWGRPMIIATPHHHYHTIYEMKADAMQEMWLEIEYFMVNIMGLPDYQCKFNNGKWQTHHHLHIKIGADENTLLSMRQTHLRKRAQPKVFSRLK